MKIDSPQAKIVSLPTALKHVSASRRGGETWVLANGVFDLFHVGHLRYLSSAADEGDRIIVAVNSDRSTRAYKGPDRPVIPQAERAEIVASIGCVDLVLVFDEPDVRAIIETLRPDVHAKGTDYTASTVPEGDLVRAYGGRVAICGDPKRHATTALVDRLKKR
ncbi:MAG: adenylyltransferase/cytidyltransferase family protein [Myxococcota bacterium]